MLIYVLILTVVMFAAGMPLLMKAYGKGDFYPVRFFAALAIIIAIGTAWIVGMEHLENATIGNSKVVAQYDELADANKNIYFDEQSGQYFCITPQDWSIKDMFIRTYLDTDSTEQYINHKNAIDSINIFGDDS